MGEKKLTQRNNALTLIEVMIALLIAIIIVIGVLSYMYACALNAREADARATAARLGLLLIEGWKIKVGDTIDYDPKTDFYDNTLIPFDIFSDSYKTIPEDPPGLTNTFRYHLIGINSINYFVKMSYVDDATNQRILNVAVAWNRDHGADSLDDYDFSRLVSQTKYARYTVDLEE